MNIIDARTWRKPHVGCADCGPPRSIKLYCGRSCQEQARKIRKGTIVGGALRDPAVGICITCGSSFEPVMEPTFCRKCRGKSRQSQPWAFFKSQTKWPHELGWLGGKLGLPSDDPRLPGLAIKLAVAKQLVVYVGKDGQVREVGRPTKHSLEAK